jgi:putative sugar O-methyltransferase
MASDVADKQRVAFEQFSSGYDNALADYRVFKAVNQSGDLPNLNLFSESQIGNPIEQFEFNGQFFSRSALNYLLGLSFLKQFSDFTEINTILEIGGGFGTLGEIVHKTMPSTQYINVDIPPTSFASEYYLQQVVGESEVSNYESTKHQEPINISELKRISVLNSWQIESLKGQVDLFVNYISFQEMEPEIVQNYLKKVKDLGAKWLLLRNMREGKQLRKNNRVGVETPILSEDYINMLGGNELDARNVMPFGYKTVDHFHSEIMLFKREDV